MKWAGSTWLTLLGEDFRQLTYMASLILNLNGEKLMYKFSCTNSNASDVGGACRHLIVRIKEHLTSTSTNIYQQLFNVACKAACDYPFLK